MALRDVLFEKKYVEIYIPVSSIPAVKKVARELEIDFFDGEEDGTMKSVFFLICDYGQLISIGYMAGVEAYATSVASPIKEVMESLQNKIDQVNKNKKNDDELG